MFDINAAKTCFRRHSLTLMLAALAPAAAVQADTWSFELAGSPVALNKNSPGHESIRMTGSGTFDTALGLVSASGTYTLFNAFDHPNGPIVHGTWHSTGFVSFGQDGQGTRAGVLVINIETTDLEGGGVGTGVMTITGDGVQGPIIADESYIVPPGGSGGGGKFHLSQNEPFFPLPL